MAEADSEQCPVCIEDNVKYWAIGQCQHPVCYVCSTRMRVLCGKKECPTCRETIEEVVFCEDISSYYKLVTSRLLQAKKYGILFENREARDAFYSLQQNTCPLCGPDANFPTLPKLKEHLQQMHQVGFCKICLEHLDLFPYEQKIYTRSERTRHQRFGDPDGSCRGHPLCNFCDERFLDKDVLYYHLKKNHFWCHFCENDGKFEFYPTYAMLRKHFKVDHFLCEYGACQNEQYVNAFRGRVDWQAHVAKVHAHEMGKSEAKIARQVEVGFSYSKPKVAAVTKETADRRPRRFGVDDDEDAMLEFVKAVSLSEVDPTQAQAVEVPKKKPPSTSTGSRKGEMDWPSLDTLMGTRDEYSAQSSSEPHSSYSSQVAVQPLRRQPPPGFDVSQTASKTKSAPSPRQGQLVNPEGEKASAFQQLEKILCDDPNKIRELKVFSNYLLRDELPAHSYYIECKALCGERWLEVFDVLITGLPDDGKRHDLREIHKTQFQPPIWVPKTKPGKQGSAKSSSRKRGSKGFHKPASSRAWSQPSSGQGRTTSGAPLRLSEEDYPSLSTPAATGTYSSGSSWSSRVVVRSK